MPTVDMRPQALEERLSTSFCDPNVSNLLQTCANAIVHFRTSTSLSPLMPASDILESCQFFVEPEELEHVSNDLSSWMKSLLTQTRLSFDIFVCQPSEGQSNSHTLIERWFFSFQSASTDKKAFPIIGAEEGTSESLAFETSALERSLHNYLRCMPLHGWLRRCKKVGNPVATGYGASPEGCAAEFNVENSRLLNCQFPMVSTSMGKFCLSVTHLEHIEYGIGDTNKLTLVVCPSRTSSEAKCHHIAPKQSPQQSIPSPALKRFGLHSYDVAKRLLFADLDPSTSDQDTGPTKAPTPASQKIGFDLPSSPSINIPKRSAPALDSLDSLERLKPAKEANLPQQPLPVRAISTDFNKGRRVSVQEDSLGLFPREPLVFPRRTSVPENKMSPVPETLVFRKEPRRPSISPKDTLELDNRPSTPPIDIPTRKPIAPEPKAFEVTPSPKVVVPQTRSFTEETYCTMRPYVSPNGIVSPPFNASFPPPRNPFARPGTSPRSLFGVRSRMSAFKDIDGIMPCTSPSELIGPFVGSFQESILSGRMSQTPNTVFAGFSSDLGCSGKDFVPPHYRSNFSAVYYHIDVDTPYVGTIELDEVGYRVPPKGIIQLTVFNPSKTPIKTFLVNYDLTAMPPHTKTFLRQKIVTETSPSHLRYAIHLRFACPRRKRFYLYRDIRVVFPHRKPDETEKLKTIYDCPHDPQFFPATDIEKFTPKRSSLSSANSSLSKMSLHSPSLSYTPGSSLDSTTPDSTSPIMPSSTPPPSPISPFMSSPVSPSIMAPLLYFG